MTGCVSRRRVVSMVVAAAGGVTAGWLVPGRSTGAEQASGTPGAPPAKVSEKDSLAVALGYVSDAKRVDPKSSPTYQAGASCSSCSWYQGKPGDAAGGPCTFFPGNLVDPHGWCKMWNKKQ